MTRTPEQQLARQKEYQKLKAEDRASLLASVRAFGEYVRAKWVRQPAPKVKAVIPSALNIEPEQTPEEIRRAKDYQKEYQKGYAATYYRKNKEKIKVYQLEYRRKKGAKPRMRHELQNSLCSGTQSTEHSKSPFLL